MVTSLYPRCADVRNVDMTNQITVWFSAYILPRKHNVRNFVFCERKIVRSSSWSQSRSAQSFWLAATCVVVVNVVNLTNNCLILLCE